MSELRSNSYRITQFLWFGAWLGVTAIAAYLRPDGSGHGTHQQLGMPPCPSVVLFGKPCPACGLTTSWTATVHGDLPAAFHAHPLGTVLYLLFTVSALVSLYGAVRSIPISTNSIQFNRAALAVALVFFGYGVWRFATVDKYRTPYEKVWSQALGRPETPSR